MIRGHFWRVAGAQPKKALITAGLIVPRSFGMLAKTREGLAKEREKLTQDVTTLKDRLARAAATRAELEQQVNVFEQRLQDLAQEMEVYQGIYIFNNNKNVTFFWQTFKFILRKVSTKLEKYSKAGNFPRK